MIGDILVGVLANDGDAAAEGVLGPDSETEEAADGEALDDEVETPRPINGGGIFMGKEERIGGVLMTAFGNACVAASSCCALCRA